MAKYLWLLASLCGPWHRNHCSNGLEITQIFCCCRWNRYRHPRLRSENSDISNIIFLGFVPHHEAQALMKWVDIY